MIRYKSTRGAKQTYTFSEVLLQGIAPDGGLFVPEKIPTFSLKQVEKLQNVSYQEIAAFIFKLFQTDIEPKVLAQIIDQAYGVQFDSKDIAPVVHLQKNQFLLELWHGPTSAFKDIALQIMPLLFVYAAKKHTPKIKYLILVATSGDTGKATLEGYKDKENIQIIVFYPQNRVAKLQQRQMETQEGSNVSVYAMKGNFDDCQKSVKEVFVDKQFAQQLLREHHTVLSSANSINWGRLLPQIVYYFFAYIKLLQQQAIRLGDQIDVVVPTGNFGNSLAALYAREMGLPIKKIICASNENNVLTEFLQTGVYNLQGRKIIKTPSPSIDILQASNIERLLFLITKDPKKVALWMQDLREKQLFDVDQKTKKIVQELFAADWVKNNDCLQNIKDVFEQTGYLMDTHTSVAQQVATRLAKKMSSNTPVLIVSTAHFAKFTRDIYRAITGVQSTVDEFVLLTKIQKLAQNFTIPKNIAGLKKKKVIHKNICAKGKTAVEKEIIRQM